MIDLNNIIIAGLDTETTGFNTPDHRFVEVYNGLYKGGEQIFEYDQRIDPERSIPAEAERVHHISAKDLIGKPIWSKVAPVQLQILNKADLIVIHNAYFDWEFLKREFERIGMKIPDKKVFCTCDNGVWATADGKSPKLQELCFACGVEYDPALAHAAKYDVDKMMECFFLGAEWGFFDVQSLFSEVAKAA